MDCSFEEFCRSSDTLRVYDGEALIFASNKDGLKPMLELVETQPPHNGQVRIYDKVVGNAAALLAVLAKCKELSSPLASELAIKTLKSYSIKYRFEKVVPFIQARDGINLCPMEKLSMDKDPAGFYEALKQKKS